MTEAFRKWVTDGLGRRQWSIRELARQSGVSHPLISQVLSDKKPSCEFCVKIALAFDESPEMALRLAGILPPESPVSINDASATMEITEIARNLPEGKRKQLLDFARFLRGQNE